MTLKEAISKTQEEHPLKTDIEVAMLLQKRFPRVRFDSIRRIAGNIRKASGKEIPKPDIETTIVEDRAKSHLKESFNETKKKYDYLLDENKKLSKLLDLQEAIKSPRPHVITAKSSKVSEAVAMGLLSDLHSEERVDKHTVNNLNEYNPDICKRRVHNYFVNLRKLTQKERQDVTIKRVVVALLGDNIHGDIHEEYKQTNYMTPIEASLFITELFITGIDYLLQDEKLEVLDLVCSVGNHSRTTLKPYTNDEAKMSYEYGIYKSLARHYKDNSRVNFIIEESYFTYMTIYGKVIRFSHGHNVKYGGGIGGLTVPLIKYIHRVNEQIKADLDCMGHFHTRFNLPNALMNGSIVGFDGYALKIGARPERPMQTFQLIDSIRGFTVNTPILVD